MENLENLKASLLQKIRQRDDINRTINQYKNYFAGILNRDIPYIDQSVRNRILNCATDYIYKMQEKGYFNQNNIHECLERLVTRVNRIYRRFRKSYDICNMVWRW